MKQFLKSFLTLVIILISGYSFLHNNDVKAFANNSVFKNVQLSKLSNTTQFQNEHLLDDAFYSETTDKSHKVHVVESEVEEELTSHKRNLPSYQSLLGSTILSFAITVFLPFQRKHNFKVKSYSYVDFYRLYAVFCVFRI